MWCELDNLYYAYNIKKTDKCSYIGLINKIFNIFMWTLFPMVLCNTLDQPFLVISTDQFEFISSSIRNACLQFTEIWYYVQLGVALITDTSSITSLLLLTINCASELTVNVKVQEQEVFICNIYIIAYSNFFSWGQRARSATIWQRWSREG